MFCALFIKFCVSQENKTDTIKIHVEGKIYKIVNSQLGLTLYTTKETKEVYKILTREGKVIKKGKFFDTVTVDPVIKTGVVAIGFPLEYAIIFNRDDD